MPAPLALAASTAARPAFSACGERKPANGLPHQLMAMPQCAITQRGSVFSTLLNDSIAAENQNECSSATPRSNSCCTAGAHDVAKCTAPSRPAAPVVVLLCRNRDGERAW